MSEPASLSVEFVETEKQIPEALWALCFPSSPESQWWYRLLEGAGINNQFQIFYGLLREGNVSVGIVPLFTMELALEFIVPKWMIALLAWLGRMLPSLSQPRILFVGSPCSDEGAIGLLPNIDRRAAMEAIHHALEREAEIRGTGMIVWKDFPESYESDFDWFARRMGYFRMVDFPGAVVDLASSRKEDYFAAMKRSRRHDIRRKLKQSAQALVAEVEILQKPDAATLECLFGLFVQTRDRAKNQFERLDYRFFERAAEEPTAHFILLRESHSRDIVAFSLCFEIGGVVINKHIGLDYTRPREWFLLFRLFDVTVDWALARNARAIHSGQSGYSAKIQQGHRLVPLTNYGRHRNGLFHRIAAAVTRRISWSTLDDDLAEFERAHPESNSKRRD